MGSLRSLQPISTAGAAAEGSADDGAGPAPGVSSEADETNVPVVVSDIATKPRPSASHKFAARSWEEHFAADVSSLAREILVHMCGESCFKYSGSKMTQICRHGFYYVVALEDWHRRRRGKPLRNAFCIVQQSKFGMQGRLLQFQEHPFECQSNYGALAAFRSNFDLQDLRRVWPQELWLCEEEELPHIGARPNWGYMDVYEWNGEEYIPRRDPAKPKLSEQPLRWGGETRLEEWRQILLRCLTSCSDGDDRSEGGGLLSQLECHATASFSDGINTGFYINAYTTKHCPTMDGVLEEMRRGLERLEQVREAARESSQDAAASANAPQAEKLVSKKRSRFGETLDVLKRLSASYRRCYWKSGAEMLFPIFYGHMTFASHRCWTVFIKKGVFMAAEAWRSEYGRAVRHAAFRDGGGEILQYIRAGMDPVPLLGWRRVDTGGVVFYEGPNGELCEDLQHVYEQVTAAQSTQAGCETGRIALTFLQKFLNECCSEKEQREDADQRCVVTTSTLEDWLHRGDHPTLAPMSLAVYAMWVYRIEKPNQKPTRRFIEIPFASHYALRNTHLQRLATEFRVPLFEGFTMPSCDVDSETAAMYKQLLLRPLAMPGDDDAEDKRLVRAFAPISCPSAEASAAGRNLEGATAFSRNWLEFSVSQQRDAMAARARFLDRFEWPSAWETAEVQETLHEMYLAELFESADDCDDGFLYPAAERDPEHCHDKEKPRTTMAQYVALIGEEMAANLEGIARARMEKRPRQYQSDATVHQAYMQVTVGGGVENELDGEAEPMIEAPKDVKAFFEPLPWDISTEEDMRKVLDFGHRTRLTPFAKELLELPCMRPGALGDSDTIRSARTRGATLRAQYRELAAAGEADLLRLATLQSNRLEVNHDEAEPDVMGSAVDPIASCGDGAKPSACFAVQDLYQTPSAYIKALIHELSSCQRLTSDQTRFVVDFADTCDKVWEDENKPPHERRSHHKLLLGQGGSGKTHVVQNLIFQAVNFIWPAANKEQPTLMVVASSNAQAKNISTTDVKARTIHNAAAMRVQELINPKMRPGNKLNQLTRLWDQVRVLIIEEVSMVSAACYNMLSFRAMHGRSKTHDVSEATYKREHHHFGRVPIVIHLGDFLQLRPTGNIGLVHDVNAKNDDGSFKQPEPPTLEIQHALRVFKAIPRVFELRGTKRFVVGDPLIDFLTCMRAGRHIPDGIWKAFEKTFATDADGVMDSRHRTERFSQGFGMGIYWETLARWISERARRDARALNVPLVFLQAVDECNTIDRNGAQRLLNIPNIHNTGHIHGVLPAHVGMRVRFTVKVNSKLGLVQEQKATIVDILFKDDDRARYNAHEPGELFRPRYLPAGIWLQVDDFTDSPIWEETYSLMDDDCCCECVALSKKRARGLLLYTPIVTEFKWRSSDIHTVKRTGFPLTHANYLTSTASQGQTLRSGVTIDCARIAQRGQQGTKDEDWWLHLYVMFSRATRMEDMLLLRPPPRALLEAGPPENVKRALERFEQKITESNEAAAALATRMGIAVPQ